MKITLEFDSIKERQDALDAINAWKYKHALSEVWEKVFRPYNDHRLSEPIAQEAFDELHEKMPDQMNLFTDHLEREYLLICEEVTEDE